MPKNIDGISRPERSKSIRNIPIPESRRKSIPLVDVAPKKNFKEALEQELELPPKPPRLTRRRRGRRGTWLLLGAGFLVLAFLILSLFRGAVLSYVPKSQPISFANDTYSASKTAGNGLMYSIVKLSGTKSSTLPATGDQQVSRKASGTIVIYNNTPAIQPFVATTRFETSERKIYRIDKVITIPAKNAAGPGSVEATVFADQPGESFNIGLSDFTVPGLKGTTKFDAIYARSKTPMIGGFVGTEKVVNPDDLTKAKATLENQLSKELIEKAKAEVPADFILYPSLATLTFQALPQTNTASNAATINLQGNLLGIMFKRSDLSATLATGRATLSPRDQLEIDSLDNLSVSFATGEPDIVNASDLNFKVTGAGTLFWKTDDVALKAAIAGQPKSRLPQIITNYPTILSATATVRPFWQSSFPTDPSLITIKRLTH